MKHKTSKSQKLDKKKVKKSIVEDVIIHVQATFNNTIVTITDRLGNTLVSLSAGMLKFKGTKKNTAFASQVTASACAKRAIEQHGSKLADIQIKGPGLGRESAIRAIQNSGLYIKTIKDVTPIPHNGCRPPKKRRV